VRVLMVYVWEVRVTVAQRLVPMLVRMGGSIENRVGYAAT
jgi:hypothetical protein